MTRRRAAPSAAVRRSVPVRTFEGWDGPAPGFVAADLIARSGPAAKGGFVQTLTLTEIATGWTECAPVLAREQRRLTEVLGEICKLLPFPLLGFGTDNGSVSMNA